MKPFTFIDLFAGIGGMRLAFESLGGKCVFTSEFERFAKQTYSTNFVDIPKGDITKIPSSDIPDHDVLLAGFPCQAFSAGGKQMGFADTRGTLFFEVARIIKDKQPRAFLLENVKGLTTHDKGQTFKTILNVLTNDLGYYVEYKVLNARDFDVPQNRTRVMIVGYRKDVLTSGFTFPNPVPLTKSVKSIMESNVDLGFYISEVYWTWLQNKKAKHEAMGHGFGYTILDPDGVCRALAVGGAGREENLLKDPSNPNHATKNTLGIRTMTPRECARAQGFPDTFKIPVSKTQAYKQFGNSVPVPLIQAVGAELVKHL